MRHWIPENWLRETPPVFHFPARVRWLATFLGFWCVGIAMIGTSYAENWVTVFVMVPVGAAGLLLNTIAWQETKE